MNGLGVVLERVRKNFAPGRSALGPLDLAFAPGDLVTVLGPSGCGKSTLLRLIAGLETPTEGKITVTPPAGNLGSRIAYVFQDAHLLPWRNVLGNVALPLELTGVPRAEREEKALVELRQLGLADTIAQFPAQLSGGMRMRVSLARALVTNPALLLLDEPFASLDEVIRQRLGENLRELWQKRRMTVVFVPHSLTEAAFLSERVVILSKGPGRIVFDRRSPLPAERHSRLRAELDFARQVADFYQVFEKERMVDV